MHIRIYLDTRLMCFDSLLMLGKTKIRTASIASLYSYTYVSSKREVAIRQNLDLPSLCAKDIVQVP